MTTNNNITIQVDSEGRNLQARLTRLSPTSVKITWVPPANPEGYYGAVVLASPTELNAGTTPTDGQQYTASTDWSAPASTIGNAKVVGAFYNDLTTNEVIVTNIPANDAVYAGVHLATNVYDYFQDASLTYGSHDGTSTVFAGRIDSDELPPTSPVVGQTYYDTVQKLVFVWDGSSWIPAAVHTTITGEVDPVSPFDGLPEGYPIIGSFFYNTRQRVLKSWNGVAWYAGVEPAKGEPTYSKVGIGTTGEQTARANIKNILKHQLGYPTVCVELNEEHFEIAINNALQEIRRRTDSAYYKQYFFMQIFEGQDKYYLNDPTKGLDGIVDVVKIHRLNMVGLTTFGPNSIYAQQFLSQFYAPGAGFDLVAVHLMHALAETYSQLFAGEIQFNWRESPRELTIYRRFFHHEKVLLECSMERPEQELLVDRWTQQWIQQWAEAELMIILGNIRGKYSNLPGPGGGMSLNADSLLSRGDAMQQDCLRQIKDFEVGQNGPDNFYSGIVIG